jgi:hypothetical protein
MGKTYTGEIHINMCGMAGWFGSGAGFDAERVAEICRAEFNWLSDRLGRDLVRTWLEK